MMPPSRRGGGIIAVVVIGIAVNYNAYSNSGESRKQENRWRPHWVSPVLATGSGMINKLEIYM